jgi:hypothetical protein
MEAEKRERLIDDLPIADLPIKDMHIDDLLESALKQYGAAEPRAGLEDRILARIQAEAQAETRAEGWRMALRNWSWWPAAIACTVLLVSIAGVFLVRNRHTDTSAAKSYIPAVSAPRQIPEIAPEKAPEKVMAKASTRQWSDGRPRPSVARGSSQPPHLDHFPSPQPLSEQEILLARFVEQFPREAAMIARAQTELLAQEEEEMQRGTPFEIKEVPQNLQEQNP